MILFQVGLHKIGYGPTKVQKRTQNDNYLARYPLNREAVCVIKV